MAAEDPSEKDLTSIFDLAQSAESLEVPAEHPLPPAEPATATVTVTATVPTPSVLDQVKHYSEDLPLGSPQVEASDPFHLFIDGPFTEWEQEKLKDLVLGQKMGIAEEDLKLQLESGRVLLPRISEYAAVLVIQALRGVRGGMRLIPSHQLGAEDESFQSAQPAASRHVDSELGDHPAESHPAESLPVTAGAAIPLEPGSSEWKVIDTLVASATLRTELVEAERSSEYQDLLEALRRELKYRAYHRGARALVNFSVNLVPLQVETGYRVTVVATALGKS